jgi:hypothetical protein
MSHSVSSDEDLNRAPHFPARSGPGAQFGLVVLGVLALLMLGSGLLQHSPGVSLTRSADGSPIQIAYGFPIRAYAAPTSACDVLNATYNGTALPDYASVSGMFQRICKSTQFVALYQRFGEIGFVIGYAMVGGSYQSVSYTYEWTANCTNSSFSPTTTCVYQQYWVGNLSNNQVAGPYIAQYLAVYEPGEGKLGSQTTGLAVWEELVLAILVIAVATGVSAAVLIHRRPPRRGGAPAHVTPDTTSAQGTGTPLSGTLNEKPTPRSPGVGVSEQEPNPNTDDLPEHAG